MTRRKRESNKIINAIPDSINGGMHTNRKGVPLLAAGCVILFATALDEFIISLLQYADFLGLLGGMTLPGSAIFNHVIIDAFRVAGFLLVMIGIFQALSSKTTQKNKQTTERTPA